MSSKFKVLQNNQWLMAGLGIYSYNLTQPRIGFFKSIIAYCILFILFFLCVIPSALYVKRNVAHFESALNAAVLCVGGLQGFVMFLSERFAFKQIIILHLKLQELVDQGN